MEGITSSSEKSFNKEIYLQNLQKKRACNIKISYSFQELGETMTDFYPRRQSSFVWSLFCKYREGDIYDAFQICRGKGIRNVAYLVGIIKNKKQYGSFQAKKTEGKNEN
ncbi:MAG: hypothetical protein VW270_02130 [Candidatus Poseidoniales archaeon]